MLPGEKDELDGPAIELAARRRRGVLTPSESILDVVSAEQKTIDDHWDGPSITMFVLESDDGESA